MRNTVQKALILEAVRNAGYHPTADDIYREVEPFCPAISRATVYRNLAQLSESGVILRVLVPNGPDRFDHTLTPHGHFICEDCGEVWDVEAPPLPVPNGFSLTRAALVMLGKCAECAKATPELAN